MVKWIECVPNFSEGQKPEVIRQIVAYIEAMPGVHLLSAEMDPDHNRTVMTFIGEAEAVGEAAFVAIEQAVQLINIGLHQGVHPRMGVADVCPLVPIGETPMSDCIRLAHQLGQRIGSELKIPVYLYEQAATRPDRKNLADIRNQQFEGLRALLGQDPAWNPDYGPHMIHPTAGAIAIGARDFLIAYNVNLQTTDVRIAQDIARKIREKDGGLPAVKALGFALATRQVVQVSMNLTDYRKSSLATVFAEIGKLAGQAGVEVADSEVVGLLPAAAVHDTFRQQLQLGNFSAQKIIEERIAGLNHDPLTCARPLIQAMAKPNLTPGTGSGAALSGAMAAALAAKVAAQIVGNSLTDGHGESQSCQSQLATLREHLLHLMREDSLEYERLLQTQAMPETTPEEQRLKIDLHRKAMIHTFLLPLDIMKQTGAVLALLPAIAVQASANWLPTLMIAWHMGMAALQSSAILIRERQRPVNDAEIQQATAQEIEQLLAVANQVYKALEAVKK